MLVPLRQPQRPHISSNTQNVDLWSRVYQKSYSHISYLEHGDLISLFFTISNICRARITKTTNRVYGNIISKRKNSVKRTVKMYSKCSVRRVCLMDLLLAPIPPASVGQQTLILSKMAALANLRLSLKLMHLAAHSYSYQAKCQAGRKKRPNSPQVLSFRFSSKKS